MPGNILLSIVSPVYRAEMILGELVQQITASCSAITPDFEIILVEDGSTDKSWQAIEDVCRQDKRVKGIKLSRNFGQHYAISAGLQESRGEFVIVMDCDLQDNPKYIADLYQKAREGYDIVFTRKQKRRHSLLKNLFARFFFFIFNWLSESQQATSD